MGDRGHRPGAVDRIGRGHDVACRVAGHTERRGRARHAPEGVRAVDRDRCRPRQRRIRPGRDAPNGESARHNGRQSSQTNPSTAAHASTISRGAIGRVVHLRSLIQLSRLHPRAVLSSARCVQWPSSPIFGCASKRPSDEGEEARPIRARAFPGRAPGAHRTRGPALPVSAKPNRSA